MSKKTTIELFKEEMKFSAGHFTIFSSTERENLHGHNFSVHASVTGTVSPGGMLVDYRALKKALKSLCISWNETFLLPGTSSFLQISKAADGSVVARFNDEEMHFLSRDVTILPIPNITLEELAKLFCEELSALPLIRSATAIEQIKIKCSSGPGQWCSWERQFGQE